GNFTAALDRRRLEHLGVDAREQFTMDLNRRPRETSDQDAWVVRALHDAAEGGHNARIGTPGDALAQLLGQQFRASRSDARTAAGSRLRGNRQRVETLHVTGNALFGEVVDDARQRTL